MGGKGFCSLKLYFCLMIITIIIIIIIIGGSDEEIARCRILFGAASVPFHVRSTNLAS